MPRPEASNAEDRDHPRRARRRGAWLVLAGLGLGASCCPAILAAPPARDVGLHGSDRILWVFEQRGAAGGELRLAFLRTGAAGPPGLQVYNAVAMRGTLDRAAVVGDALDVLFSDGTHRRFEPRPLTLRGAPSSVPSPQTPLPGAAPRAACLAVDATTSVLYAVVAIQTARDIHALGQPDAAQAEAEAEPAGAADLDWNATWMLARCDSGIWSVDRALPDAVGDRAAGLLAACDDGDVFLIFPDPTDGARFFEAVSRSDAAQDWTCTRLDILHSDERPVAVRIQEDHRRILAAKGPASDLRLAVLHNTGSAWERRVELEGTPSAKIQDGPQGADFAGQEIAAIVTTPDGGLHVARWNAEGRLISGPMALTALNQAGRTMLRDAVIGVLELAVVPVVLLVILLRRRQTVLLPLALGEGQTLAPLSSRVAAFLIDLAVLAPVQIAIGYALLETPADVSRLPSVFDVLHSFTALPVDFFWTLVACSMAFCVYGFLMEARTGATLGKRLLGLRVVHASGAACRVGPALVRNLLRLVDVFFPPGLLLALMTVNRQRIGDIIARTVVVLSPPAVRHAEDEAPSPQETPPSDTEQKPGPGASRRSVRLPRPR